MDGDHLLSPHSSLADWDNCPSARNAFEVLGMDSDDECGDGATLEEPLFDESDPEMAETNDEDQTGIVPTQEVEEPPAPHEAWRYARQEGQGGRLAA